MDKATDSVTCLTGDAECAIAVFRFEGTTAMELASNHLRLRTKRAPNQLDLDRIHYGFWNHVTLPPPSLGAKQYAETEEPLPNASLMEDVVVCRTGQHTLEVHTHGGKAVRASLSAICQQAEMRFTVASAEASSALDSFPNPALDDEWKAWLERCFQNTLLSVSAPGAVDALLLQRNGILRQRVEEILLLEKTQQNAALQQLRDTWRFGRHLTQPIVVLLTGRPNVGKSSLINALLGYQRSIVSAMPGTTRDLVAQETVIGGLPFRLVDSAGIRDTEHPLEKQGVHLAQAAQQGAHVVVQIVSADQIDQPLHSNQQPNNVDVYVLNKADLLASSDDVPATFLLTSTIANLGIAELLDTVLQQAKDRLRFPVDWTQQPFVFCQELDNWLAELQEQD